MNRKQAISLALRIGLSFVMLGVLIWRVPSFDLDEVVPELTLHTVVWLVVAAAAHAGRAGAVRPALAAGARGARPARRR